MDAILQARALLWQLAACALALVAFVVMPPARGRMLLVPLFGTADGALLRIVLAQGGGLVGRGPLPRSMVVSGDWRRLAGPMGAAGAILLAAPRGCGETSA